MSSFKNKKSKQERKEKRELEIKELEKKLEELKKIEQEKSGFEIVDGIPVGIVVIDLENKIRTLKQMNTSWR